MQRRSNFDSWSIVLTSGCTLVASAILIGCGSAKKTTGNGSLGGDDDPMSCSSSGTMLDMVSVPAGDFFMGCNSAVDTACRENEQPGRTVTLSAFQIDSAEVTQDEYAACLAAGACGAPSCNWDCSRPNLPASCITQPLAAQFCAWAGKRLPTEAEWEKAARGTDGRIYPWGNDPPTCDLTNMDACAGGMLEVGSTSGTSPYGASDMAGNMVEMVADWFDSAYYASAPNTDPQGPTTGSKYSGRGGGWHSTATWQRSSMRDWYNLTDAGLSLGFRCAK